MTIPSEDLRKQKARETMRRFRIRHKERLHVYLQQRRKDKIAAMSPQELADFREKESAKTKRLSARIKNEVFEAYGGWVCACCGETEKLFLTIDHMENNGSQLRKAGVHGHSTQFYRWLKNNGFPSGFQVLCMNCQFGKRMNNGICPHQVTCNDQSKDVGSSESKKRASHRDEDMIWSAWRHAAAF